MNKVNDRCKRECHGELIHVIDYTNGHDPTKTPIGANVKSNEKYHKAVDELRDESRPCGAQPN